jgi:hypothetical protein
MNRSILHNENNTKTLFRFKVCDQEDDAESIVGLAREAHALIRFGYIPFSEAKVRKIVEKALLSPKRQGILLAYKGDTLVGGAFCSVGEYHIGTGTLLTTIHNINVAQTTRAVGLAAAKWRWGCLKASRAGHKHAARKKFCSTSVPA